MKNKLKAVKKLGQMRSLRYLVPRHLVSEQQLLLNYRVVALTLNSPEVRMTEQIYLGVGVSSGKIRPPNFIIRP